MPADVLTVREEIINLSPKQLEEFESCVRSKESVQATLLGALYGGAFTSFPLLLLNARISKSALVALSSIGAVYGYIFSKFTTSANCLRKIFPHPKTDATLLEDNAGNVNMYENGMHRLNNQKLVETEPKSTEESLFDMDIPLQTALFDELPSTGDSASLSVEEQKEPERTVTYSELRQRNRQLYGSKQKSSWVNESDVSPNPDARKRKTRYGDVWE